MGDHHAVWKHRQAIWGRVEGVVADFRKTIGAGMQFRPQSNRHDLRTGTYAQKRASSRQILGNPVNLLRHKGITPRFGCGILAPIDDGANVMLLYSGQGIPFRRTNPFQVIAKGPQMIRRRIGRIGALVRDQNNGWFAG